MPLSLLLHCKDLAETQAFYAQLPGFTVQATAEHTLTVKAHGATLVFTAQDLWKSPPVLSGTLYITVADVGACYTGLKDRATVAWPLQDMPHGSREFALTDCNGYLLAFQQQV
ncbi:MAG: bleomycin resistance family protein [Polaromonas sp.]|nr:bleomycin resistance family protein [Polaromonas sp.]